MICWHPRNIVSVDKLLSACQLATKSLMFHKRLVIWRRKLSATFPRQKGNVWPILGQMVCSRRECSASSGVVLTEFAYPDSLSNAFITFAPARSTYFVAIFLRSFITSGAYVSSTSTFLRKGKSSLKSDGLKLVEDRCQGGFVSGPDGLRYGRPQIGHSQS